jgi:hypothetical protein
MLDAAHIRTFCIGIPQRTRCQKKYENINQSYAVPQLARHERRTGAVIGTFSPSANESETFQNSRLLPSFRRGFLDPAQERATSMYLHPLWLPKVNASPSFIKAVIQQVHLVCLHSGDRGEAT